MSRAERLLALVQFLRRHRHPVTAASIAEELGVSERTVYRDIAALIASRTPIRGEAGIGYVLEPGCDLPPMMLTVDEIEAVLIGVSWLRGRADPTLARAAEDVLAKIGAILPPALKPVLFDATLIVPSQFSGIIPEQIDMEPLRRAIRDNRKVHITYRDAQSEATQRIIWPIGLSYFEHVRIIIAWCETRGDFRHFRTDRIESFEVLEARYPRRRAVLMQEWKRNMAASNKMKRGSGL